MIFVEQNKKTSKLYFYLFLATVLFSMHIGGMENRTELVVHTTGLGYYPDYGARLCKELADQKIKFMNHEIEQQRLDLETLKAKYVQELAEKRGALEQYKRESTKLLEYKKRMNEQEVQQRRLNLDLYADQPFKTIEEKIEKYLNQETKPQFSSYSDGTTILHDVVWWHSGNSDYSYILQAFINRGADPYAIDNNGNTIFHAAANVSCKEYAKVCSLTEKQRLPRETMLVKTILMIKKREGNCFSKMPPVLIHYIFNKFLLIPTKHQPESIAQQHVLKIKNKEGKTAEELCLLL